MLQNFFFFLSEIHHEKELRRKVLPDLLANKDPIMFPVQSPTSPSTILRRSFHLQNSENKEMGNFNFLLSCTVWKMGKIGMFEESQRGLSMGALASSAFRPLLDTMQICACDLFASVLKLCDRNAWINSDVYTLLSLACASGSLMFQVNVAIKQHK